MSLGQIVKQSIFQALRAFADLPDEQRDAVLDDLNEVLPTRELKKALKKTRAIARAREKLTKQPTPKIKNKKPTKPNLDDDVIDVEIVE